MIARWEGRLGRWGKRVKGKGSTNRQLQNSLGDVKYSVGNSVDKEQLFVIHGRGPWCKNCLREWGSGAG